MRSDVGVAGQNEMKVKMVFIYFLFIFYFILFATLITKNIITHK